MDLWKNRNEDVHRYDGHQCTQQEAEQREASHRSDLMYSQQNQMEPMVQPLLLLDVQEHTQRPTWMNHY